jgi:hypothetical protein
MEVHCSRRTYDNAIPLVAQEILSCATIYAERGLPHILERFGNGAVRVVGVVFAGRMGQPAGAVPPTPALQRLFIFMETIRPQSRYFLI